MKKQKYIVYVDDNFHYMDEDYQYKLGEFESLECAIKVCKAIVDSELEELGREYYHSFCLYGESPWILPPDGAKGHFSARDYANKKAKQLLKNEKNKK